MKTFLNDTVAVYSVRNEIWIETKREREREIKGVVRDRERERKRRKAERGNSLYLSRLLEALIL